jgi:hypothetical protein
MLFTLSVYQVCSLDRFDPLESLEWLSNRAMKLKKRRLRSVCWTLLTGVMRSTFAKSGNCLHKVCTWDSEIQKRPETTRLRTNKNILTTAKFNLSAKVALYLFWFNECWKWFTCLQMRSDNHIFVQICSWRITHWSDNLNWLQETLDSLQIVVFCDLTKCQAAIQYLKFSLCSVVDGEICVRCTERLPYATFFFSLLIAQEKNSPVQLENEANELGIEYWLDCMHLTVTSDMTWFKRIYGFNLSFKYKITATIDNEHY